MSTHTFAKDSCIVLLVFIALIITSCSAQAPTSAPNPTAISTSIPSPAPTIKATNTATLTPTAIPGFEDWSVFNPGAVDIQSENGSLILTLTRHALWFMQQRGVLVYKPVSGNFKITADVHSAKHSDLTKLPGGDGSVQLGGLMARNGNGGQENYVFIVVGDDGDGLSIETKNTTQGLSKFNGPAWDSADAELRLCRVGQTFNLYQRHVNTRETWVLATAYDRPDLPNDLQVGVNIYTDGTPDLQIRYDNIKIESVTSLDECTNN